TQLLQGGNQQRFTQPTRTDTPPQILKGQLVGLVVDSNNKPIANATIAVLGAGSVRSDNDGKFGIGNLAQGNYRVTATKSNFVDVAKTVTIRGGSSTRQDFEMKSDKPISTIDPRVTQPLQIRVGNLRGQVTDAKSGRPIAGATIAISGRGSLG